MKTLAWSAIAFAGLTVALAACGSSKSSGSGATGGTGVTSSTSHSSSSVTVGTGTATGGSGGGSSDPVCSNINAMVSPDCITCVQQQEESSSSACIQAFVQMCETDASCVAFGTCLDGCHNLVGGSTGGAGGGSTACAAMDSQGGGGAADNCDACCDSTDSQGSTDYITDLIQACVCAAGAPCAAACAM